MSKKPVVLPVSLEHLPQKIGDLPVGVSVWVNELSLKVDEDRGCWVDASQTFNLKWPYSGAICLTRSEDGVIVEVPSGSVGWVPNCAAKFFKNHGYLPVIELLEVEPCDEEKEYRRLFGRE
jgi:hypothetical protein